MFNKPKSRWWTVVAGIMGNAGGAGVIASYCLGVFTKPIAVEFGWDRSFATAGLACFFIAAGIGLLTFGSVISKWAIRPVTMAFVAIFAATIMSVALLPKSIILFCLAFSVMGFFGAGASPMPYSVAISAQFNRRRGMALAIAVCGAGLGAALMPGYAGWLLAHFGWRGGYVGIGLVAGLLALTGLLLFFREPQVKRDEPVIEAPSLWKIYTSEPVFWLIAVPIFLISIALTGTTSNITNMLTDRGMSTAEAVGLVGVSGGASWLSRIGVGVALDHIHVRYISAMVFISAALGMVIFASGAGGAWPVVAAMLAGLGLGAEADLVAYVVSRYFPKPALGRAMGAVWIFWAWGNGVGVFLGSLSFDFTRSYMTAMVVFAGLSATAALLILRLGTYKYPADHHKAEIELA